ncbi:MAG TPA: hypothetical protein VIH05_02735 [Tepidiformaceae bacterium]|jgi:hypothetical protein
MHADNRFLLALPTRERVEDVLSDVLASPALPVVAIAVGGLVLLYLLFRVVRGIRRRRKASGYYERTRLTWGGDPVEDQTRNLSLRDQQPEATSGDPEAVEAAQRRMLEGRLRGQHGPMPQRRSEP